MSVSIERGANLSLTKLAPNLQEIFVGVGWENPESGSHDFELDASLFLLGHGGKVRNDGDFIFYNQKSDGDESVYHVSETPDDAIGRDREGFTISLARISDEISTLACCLTIDQATARQQCFGNLSDLHVRLVNRSDRTEILRYHVSADLGPETAALLGELYRFEQGWKFRAVGQGFTGGLASMAANFGVQVDSESATNETKTSLEKTPDGVAHADEEEATDHGILKRKRRSTMEIVSNRTEQIKEKFKAVLPQITMAALNGSNESNTRMILDRILQDVLGFEMTDISTEQKIQGRKADYVISVGGNQAMVIETKRIGSQLRDKQIFQSTSYAAYAGIHWALLTNVVAWQLYRVSTQDKVEANLVFEIDLQNGLDDQSAYHFTLISKFGLERQGLLEKIWAKRSALSCEGLISALLNEEVLSKIRAVIVKATNCQVTNQEVQAALEKDILDL